MFSIEQATDAAAAYVAENMRQADRDEIWAAGRLTPQEAIERSLEVSRDTAGVGVVDGEPVCAFGIGQWSALALHGIPWLLGTDKLVQHAALFLRRSRQYMDVAKVEYKILENHVDARNTETLKWLGWLGFTVDPALPFGPDRLPFHRFHWEAE